MDSPTLVQVTLAVAMLVLLVGALWPKLACRASVGDQTFRTRHSKIPGQQITFQPGTHSRHALRVRESYDRMFGQWLRSKASSSDKDRRAA